MLVGRAIEMAELERAYKLARETRQSCTVTVVGAPGIGKTRLVREFLRLPREGGRLPRVFRGASREGGPAYEAFARVLRARFGIVEGMDPEAAKAQVRAQVAAVLEDRKVGDVAYFLGQLIDLRFQDSPLIRALEGDPQPMGAMRRAVIKSFLDTDAGKGVEPLVLVFDDLHWAHDDSLELLSYLVESVHGPVLIVGLARPAFLARRGARRRGGERHVTIELAPLSEDDASAVMRDWLAPCHDPPAVDKLVDAAVTLAGGNPALLEQIVRIYHDTGVLEVADDFEDDRWTAHMDRLTGIELPLTVNDAVQVRVAALAPRERALLERAAAMGGVFWLGGLMAIQRLDARPPEAWEGGEADDVVASHRILSDLVERDYVLRLPDSTFHDDDEYVFKHNLEREALVNLTPPASARRYHQAIAEWLTFREGADAGEEYLEMLARHRERGGATALAASAYVQAGEVARSRFAKAKAAELFTKGLELMDRCDQPDEHVRLKALHSHGDVLQSLGRTADAFRAFEEMLARAWRLDLRSKGGAAHSRIGRLHRETGSLEEASRHLTAALALFGQARDDRGIASTLDDIGKLYRLKGHFVVALEYTERALAMRRKLGDRGNVSLSLHNLGLVQLDSGNRASALDAFEQALLIRRELGDVVGMSLTLECLGKVAQVGGDDEKALALFQEAHEFARDTGDRSRVRATSTNLGQVHARLGHADRAAAALRQADELADDAGAEGS